MQTTGSSSKFDRRAFLQTGASAAAGLLIGFYLPEPNVSAAPTPPVNNGIAFAPNAFLRVAIDNVVTVISKHVEVGQGIYTGIATILAEELDADWSQIKVEAAPPDDNLYRNRRMGVMATCCSYSIIDSYDEYRHAGAMARAMLVAAAAARWKLPVDEIAVDNGVVKHAASSRKATFGQLARAAASIPPPSQVKLKDPKEFQLIGNPHTPRVDSRDKTRATAMFAIDVALPGMLTALVARPPRFGATVRSFDDSQAKAVPGVTDVVPLPTGVAVVAKSFPAAQQGRDALRIEWDESKAEMRGTPELLAEYRKLLEQPGAVARRDGDFDGAFTRAARTLTATFEFPYLAHTPIGPFCNVVRLSPYRCEIWCSSHGPSTEQRTAARIAGLRDEQVQVYSMYSGGSFGSGATVDETVEVAKAIRNRAPVKLLWTREEIIRGGWYRPMYVHELKAGLDSDGNLVAWRHRIVGQSIFGRQQQYLTNGVDITSVGGASNIPYDIPNILVELHSPAPGVSVSAWRSVGDSHCAFAVETFLDDIAHAGGRDPYEMRRALLARDPREKAIQEFAASERFRDSLFAKFPRQKQVLELAAEKAGWGTPLPAGRGRGIAVHYSFRAVLAYVAEVTAGPAGEVDGRVKVDRIVCAVDCGRPINPDVIRAQVEGGVGFGLSAMLHEGITLKDGKVVESNFHDYGLLRFDEMPKVEVYIVPSEEPPMGIGEPGVPPIAPAVSNAIFAATGKRQRVLPLLRAV